MNCPFHKVEMQKVRDVENEYWPGEIAHTEYSCSECGYLWCVNGFDEMWQERPPKKVIIKKDPKEGDKYSDAIEELPEIDN